MEKALKYIYGVLVLLLLILSNYALWLIWAETYTLRTGLAEIFQGLACSIRPESERGPGIVRLK